ncbi:hypothetical protein ATANTOWER_027761 [Ataeniobius toweri]|uniref:Uncharacterized protein n=1 Tax=Ataeniobius toweri TaxID=208326 RepID=A0ABU7AUS3_9TELE|nr:hypothetical protein [Ataeniobius toweri]
MAFLMLNVPFYFILSLNLLTYAKQTNQQKKRNKKKNLKLSSVLTRLLNYREGGGLGKDNRDTDKRRETMINTKSVASPHFTHVHASRGCRVLKDKGSTAFLSVTERAAAGGGGVDVNEAPPELHTQISLERT